MKKISDKKPIRPVKIIQFGGGVFLRGFFDWMLQRANNAGIFNGDAVIVRSLEHGKDPLSAQDFKYTHLARDNDHNDVTLVDSICDSISIIEEYERFLALAENPDTEVIVSNTTEAGIVYEKCDFSMTECPKGYPAKVCALLYRRFSCGLSPMLLVPCELIENNGKKLKEYVVKHAHDWNLGEEFYSFIEKCVFKSTLVDRIVSGRTSEVVDLGYEDNFVNTSEYFNLFVIDGEKDERLPFDERIANVKYVPDITPYRTIKVRILNGAHTSMIPYALLCGVESVRECLENEEISTHLRACLAEIVESLDIDRDECEKYASEVLKRFSNRYIHHRCAAISLNSVSKFKVRVLPSILEYERKYGKAPSHLIFSLAKLIEFYKNGTPNDDAEAMSKLKNGTITQILSDATLWGEDISRFASEVENANTSK